LQPLLLLLHTSQKLIQFPKTHTTEFFFFFFFFFVFVQGFSERERDRETETETERVWLLFVSDKGITT
jgi:hypothetical protein